MKGLLKKKWFIPVLICAAVLIAAVIVTVFVLSSKNKSFRIIKLEDYEGTVAVNRNNALLELFKGLQLSSGDYSTTGEESQMGLLIDSDKHMVVTQNTEFEVKSSGTEEKGKVSIEIKKGKAFFAIENKLSNNSDFVVNTPNATTSVRGTTFAASYDSANNTTVVFVEEGAVEIGYGANQKISLSQNETAYIKDDTLTTAQTNSFDCRVGYDVINADYLSKPYIWKFDSPLTQSFFDEKVYELLPVINDFFESNKSDYVQKVAEKEKNTGLSIYDADFREPYLEKNITDFFPDEIVIDAGNGAERFRVEKAALHLEVQYVYDDYEPDTPELIDHHRNYGKPVYIEDNNDPSHDGKYKYLTSGAVVVDLNLTPLGPAEEIPDYGSSGNGNDNTESKEADTDTNSGENSEIEYVDPSTLEPIESGLVIDKTGMSVPASEFDKEFLDGEESEQWKEIKQRLYDKGAEITYAGGYYIYLGDYLICVSDSGVQESTFVEAYRRWPSKDENNIIGERQPFDFNTYYPEFEEEIFAIFDWFFDYVEDKPVIMGPPAL